MPVTTRSYNEPDTPQSDFFAAVAAGLAPVWRVGNGKLSANTRLTYNYFRRFSRERGTDATLAGRVELPVAAIRVYVDAAYLNVRHRLNLEVDQRARREEANFRAGIEVPAGSRTTAGVDVHRATSRSTTGTLPPSTCGER